MRVQCAIMIKKCSCLELERKKKTASSGLSIKTNSPYTPCLTVLEAQTSLASHTTASLWQGVHTDRVQEQSEGVLQLPWLMLLGVQDSAGTKYSTTMYKKLWGIKFANFKPLRYFWPCDTHLVGDRRQADRPYKCLRWGEDTHPSTHHVRGGSPHVQKKMFSEVSTAA